MTQGVHPLWARITRRWAMHGFRVLFIRLYYFCRRQWTWMRWRRLTRRLVGPVPICVDIGPGLCPQTFIQADCVRYVEPHHEYVACLRASGKFVVQMTAIDWLALSLNVDAIILTDVIEHMDKRVGQRVLYHAQQQARAIVLTTPLGFAEYDGGDKTDCWGLQGQYWQRHRSGWLPEEFDLNWSIDIDPDYYNEPGTRCGAFLAVWRKPAP